MTTFTFAPGLAVVYSLSQFVPNPGHHLMNDTSEFVDTSEKLLEVGEVGFLEVLIDEVDNVLGDRVVSALGRAHLYVLLPTLPGPESDVGVPRTLCLAHVSQYDSHTSKTHGVTVGVFLSSHNTKSDDGITVIHAMAPSDEAWGAKLQARVPTNVKSAVEDLAYNRSTQHERYPKSRIVREAVERYLIEHRDELSEEALDDLDEDRIANGGAGGGF